MSSSKQNVFMCDKWLSDNAQLVDELWLLFDSNLSIMYSKYSVLKGSFTKEDFGRWLYQSSSTNSLKAASRYTRDKLDVNREE